MSYIGSTPTQTAFVTDQFSGNGSTTVFTMSVGPANTAAVLVSIHGVVQDPSTYAVNGNILTFSSAPPTGTGNISCRYLGIPASAVNTTAYRTVTDFTATLAQTTFTVPSYTVGYIDVYRNGVKLGIADYTATSGTTVVLANACAAGDLVETVSLYVSSVLNAIQQYNGSSVNQILTTPTINTFGSAASNNLVLQTNGGTTAMTLDVSGNVCVATTAPGAGFSGPQLVVGKSANPYGIIEIQGAKTGTDGSAGLLIFYNTSGSSRLAQISAERSGADNSGALTFQTWNAGTGAERMRIDSNGYLLLGQTSYSAPAGTSFQATPTYTLSGHVSGTASGQGYAYYYYNANNIGSITQSGTTAVLYNTTSDYRLKSNIAPVTTGLSVINQLNPVNFTWISDNEDDTGFLAHEFQSVIPRAVTGEKDAVDKDGKPVYQQMDNSGAIPYLVASIKELSAQVTELKAEVQALKGA